MSREYHEMQRDALDLQKAGAWMTAALQRVQKLQSFTSWMNREPAGNAQEIPADDRRSWTGDQLKEQWDFITAHGVPRKIDAQFNPIEDDDL